MQENRDYHVHNNAQATRLAVKGLGTSLHQGIWKDEEAIFFPVFIVCILMESNGKKYLFTFRH